MEARRSKKSSRKLAEGISESSAMKISGFAQRMMEKQGWKEGQGLGAQEQGRTSIIRVKKKDGTVGLGAKNEQETEYLAPGLAADPHMAELESVRNAPISQYSDSSSEDEDGEDNGMDLSKMTEADRALFLMCGKRRLGRRAGMAQKGKWKREMKASQVVQEVVVPVVVEQDEEEELARKEQRKREKKEKKRARRDHESSD
jgi:hypothetical protein